MAKATRMTSGDYREPGPVIDQDEGEDPWLPVCECCGETEMEECEGCSCCQECCNCTESDCDCDACAGRRLLEEM